jgi:hypothetical protein
MSAMYLVDGNPVMCETCEKFPAKYYVSGTIPSYYGICPRCAGDICAKHGDTAGMDKFYSFAIEWETAYKNVMVA